MSLSFVRVWARCAVALGLIWVGSESASAQERPAPAVDFSAAWVGFADDGVVGEPLVGGAFRWYLSPRVAVGPELVYISGSRHSHTVVTGNVWWDLAPRRAGASSRVTPFLVAGGGAFSTRTDFVRETFTSWEGAFTAGGGVRVAASDRVEVGVDARVGWELHLRVGGVVGIRLGR